MIFNKEWAAVSEEELIQQTYGKKIVIFGASRRNDRIFQLIDKKRVAYIYDNDEKKWGTTYEGILVQKPIVDSDAVFLTALTDYRAIVSQFHELRVSDIYYFMEAELYAFRYQKYIEYYMRDSWAHSFREKHHNFRYIHVFSDDKFFLPTVAMIEKAFDMREHAFIIYCFNRPNINNRYGNWEKYKELSTKYGNVTIIDTWENFYGVNNKEILTSIVPELKECKQILFHGEWLEECIRTFFVQEDMFEMVKRKGVWFPWSGNVGADKSNEKYIETLLKYCRVIACSYDFMYDHLCERVVMPRHYRLNNGLSYAWIVDRPKTQHNGRNVLLGQACFRANKNIESMKILEKFKGDIEVYCIVSYGQEDYIREVVTEGKKIFGEKFHIITEFMAYPQFVEFLNQMDVAVYGMEVSASYDTLQILFWLKKKVYLKKDSDIDVMTRSYGYYINDFYHIKDETLETFLANEETEKNLAISQKEFDNDLKIQQWRELFEIDMEKILRNMEGIKCRNEK